MRHPFLLLPCLLFFASPVLASTDVVQSTVTQTQGFHSFYLPEEVRTEELVERLATLQFLDPVTKRPFTLDISMEDPMIYTAPTQVFTLHGRTFPIAVEHSDSVPGTKVSLVSHRIVESIPGHVRDRYSATASDVLITYDDSTPHAPYRFEGQYSTGTTILHPALFHTVTTHLSLPTETIHVLPLLSHAPSVHTQNLPADTTPITHLVAEGVSNFSGSSVDRIHNIQTAANRYNGIVIKQGAEFSFNTLLGPVDDSTGYRKELVIKGPRTIPEFGGGVCQVSSTIFRAALYGGLPITERKAHSYAVSYYQPWGTDATIYPGVVDFRFVNDTPGDLIVQAYVEAPYMHFKLYGIRDGRTVTTEGPFVYAHQSPPAPVLNPVGHLAPGQRELMQNPVVGFQAHWNRTVTYPDGEQKEHRFHSNYQARPAHYNVGPTPVAEEAPVEQEA